MTTRPFNGIQKNTIRTFHLFGLYTLIHNVLNWQMYPFDHDTLTFVLLVN